MKQLFYNLIALLFCLNVIAQKRTFYKKSLAVNTISELHFNFKDVSIVFEPSKDDKVHFDFSFDFKNYSTKQQDSIIKLVNIDVNESKNILKMAVIVKDELPTIKWGKGEKRSEELKNIYFDNIGKNRKADDKHLKKEAIEKRYYSEIEFRNSYNTKYKKEALNAFNTKISDSDFKIYLPKKLLKNLNLDADFCHIQMNDLSLTNAKIFTNDSYLRIKELIKSNLIKHNGTGFIKEVNSSILTLRSNMKITLAKIADSNVITENSKLIIGEITKYTDVKDYNSDFIFFNFGNSFKNFTLKGEYSKIDFYPPKNDYSLKAYGNSSSFIIDGTTTKIGSKKDNKKNLMLEVRDKKKNGLAGNMKFDLVNAVVEFKDK